VQMTTEKHRRISLNYWRVLENTLENISDYLPLSRDSPKTKKYSTSLTPTSWKIASTWCDKQWWHVKQKQLCRNLL